MLENRSDQIAGTQGRTQDLELGGAQVAYPGYEKWEALQVRYTKSGGGGASGPIYEKWGGGGGGGIPLQIPWGAQKISTCTYLRAT